MDKTKAAEREGKRAPLSLRTTKILRDRLEQLAELNGRSLTQEVEFRLERSLDQDELMIALVGDQSHAQNLVRAISTVIRRAEGLKEKKYTNDWETLFYCRRAVSRVCFYMLGSDYNDEEFLAIFAKDDEEKKRFYHMADQFAFDAVRDLGLGLPTAPGGKDQDLPRRLPSDTSDDDLE